MRRVPFEVRPVLLAQRVFAPPSPPIFKTTCASCPPTSAGPRRLEGAAGRLAERALRLPARAVIRGTTSGGALRLRWLPRAALFWRPCGPSPRDAQPRVAQPAGCSACAVQRSRILALDTGRPRASAVESLLHVARFDAFPIRLSRRRCPRVPASQRAGAV